MGNISTNTLYKALKQKESRDAQAKPDAEDSSGEPMLALDDTERTKVLSPGRLVAKRFFRNRLAMVGLCLLIFMFVFAFAAPIFYPYTQTQIFYKFDALRVDYASATERTVNTLYAIPGGPDVGSSVLNRFNSFIADMKEAGLEETSVVAADDREYMINMLSDGIYLFSVDSMESIGTFYINAEIARYNRLLDEFEWSGDVFPAAFQDSAVAAVNDGEETFEFEGTRYDVSRSRNFFIVTLPESTLELNAASPGDGFLAAVEDNLGGEAFEFGGGKFAVEGIGAGAYAVLELGGRVDAYIASTYVFNAFDTTTSFSEEFMRNALFAVAGDGTFSADGNTYSVETVNENILITDSAGHDAAVLSNYAVRRYTGQDTLSIEFKNTVENIIEEMVENNQNTAEFVYPLQFIDEFGVFVFDDNGDPVLADTDILVTRRPTGEFVLTCEQITYLIDIFSQPTSANPFGTDGDGMDILARMMYGGRISLMVGFVVVLIEIFFGVLLGGISGYFSGPVDTLIMRIADVFYCIPAYPILIIMGALFDKLRMDPYERLMWMMVMLGLLGWAGIARLVRGQILSLREQEFMHAQEATGMKTRRRIFRHLVPNVMPQLIVTATMGVGSVIIYESTLSFLGLGVKHPLATWGTMINSVTSSSEAIIRYSYIWLPVGALICLTVIAFNFVGDGLRDAFDPKMKR